MTDQKKILVTGAAGLLGANFVRHLLSKGHIVIGVDDLSGGYREFLPDKNTPNWHFYPFKISEILVDETMEGVDCVYHFAAMPAAGLSPFIREHNYRENIMESAALINAAIRENVKRFIFTSSMEVYGSEQPPFVETMTPRPETPYGIAKYAVEMDLESAYMYHGLEYRIVRPHNVHGIYQNIWDRYRNVIGIFIRQALAGEDITVFGDGLQVRAFSDVEFYMDPLEKLMTDNVKIDTYAKNSWYWNIGADKPTTILELAKIVQKVAKEHGNNINIVHKEPRKEVANAHCNHDKAKADLDFEDCTDLEQLVRKMYAWAKEQKPRPVKTVKYELEKGIYSYWK